MPQLSPKSRRYGRRSGTFGVTKPTPHPEEKMNPTLRKITSWLLRPWAQNMIAKWEDLGLPPNLIFLQGIPPRDYFDLALIDELNRQHRRKQ